MDPDPNPDPERKYVNVGFTKIIFTTMCPVVGYRYTSIADPGCLSRILDPDFYPDPKTATKERGEKKIVVIPFYVATNFTK